MKFLYYTIIGDPRAIEILESFDDEEILALISNAQRIDQINHFSTPSGEGEEFGDDNLCCKLRVSPDDSATFIADVVRN